MRILVAGDWHGDTDHAVKMVLIARRLGIKRIIQCGDFGIWTHTKDGVVYLDTLNEALRLQGQKVYFVPGNHENFDHIEWWERNYPQTTHGNIIVRSQIVMLRKSGAGWEWGGNTFAAVGGGVSIDRMWRKTGESWWPQEQLTEEEVVAIEQGGLGENIDYLFTHDAPTNLPMVGLKNDEQSHSHRQKMDRVAKALRPRWWFHGHMHHYMTYDFPSYESFTNVIGLDMNGTQASWGVLDTEEDMFTPSFLVRYPD